MKTVLLYSKTFVLLIAAYFVFGVLSCWLPDKSIKANIEKSAPVLEAEGLYPKAIIHADQCWLDNFTDALIMNQIYNIDRKRPVYAAMKVVRSSAYGNDWNQPGLLLRRTQGEKLAEAPYARYWHGNTFFFRPWFIMMDFNLVRWWLFVISTLLMIALFCTYYREAGLLKTLALASGFVATCGFVTQFSMQFFPVLAITIIASLLIVKKSESKNFGMLFFVVGSLTCFFDLLTTPLLTLGLPLAVLLSLKRNDSFQLKDSMMETIKMVLLWGLGFALTFVTKWALATLVLGYNVFADAYDTSLYRLGVEDFTRWDAVSRNFKMLNLPMIVIAALALIILMVVRRSGFHWKKALLFLLVGLAPYVWYLVLSNHSYLHWWFTYRLQAISVVCLFLMLTDTEQKTKIPS